jgi:hypothetical protein
MKRALAAAEALFFVVRELPDRSIHSASAPSTQKL